MDYQDKQRTNKIEKCKSAGDIFSVIIYGKCLNIVYYFTFILFLYINSANKEMVRPSLFKSSLYCAF